MNKKKVYVRGCMALPHSPMKSRKIRAETNVQDLPTCLQLIKARSLIRLTSETSQIPSCFHMSLLAELTLRVVKRITLVNKILHSRATFPLVWCGNKVEWLCWQGRKKTSYFKHELEEPLFLQLLQLYLNKNKIKIINCHSRRMCCFIWLNKKKKENKLL